MSTNDPHSEQSIEGKNLTQQVMSGVGWTYLSTFFKISSQLVFLAVLSRLLTPRDFGLVGMALVFTNLAERLGQLGLGPALIQIEKVSDESWRSCRTVNYILGIAATALIWFSAESIAAFYGEPSLAPILQLLSFIFVFEGLCIVGESWLNRHLKFKHLAAVENISYFSGYCLVALPFAYFGYGVWSLVFSQLTIRIVKFIMLLWLAHPAEGYGCKWSVIKELFKLGSGFTIGRLLNFAAGQGDNLVVGKTLGAESLGLYGRIYQLMTIPAVYVAQVLDKVLFPAMALRQKNAKKVGEAMLMLVEVVSLISLPLSALFIVIPREIILVLFGNQWDDADRVLQIFAFGIFFRAGYKCGDTVIRSMGKVFRYAAIQIVYSVTVVGGAFVGAHLAGLEGVAFAVLIAVILNYLIISRTALKLCETSLLAFMKAHLGGVWLAGIVILFAYPVALYCRYHGLHAGVTVLVVMVIVSFGGLLGVKWMPQQIFPQVIPFILRMSMVRSLTTKKPKILKLLKLFLPLRVF